MFRVLVVNVKKATTAVRITSPSQGTKMNLTSLRAWNSRVLGETRKEPDEELLHVVRVDRTVQVESTLASNGSGTSEIQEDKLYDGTLRQY
jgi:hypothetical protein